MSTGEGAVARFDAIPGVTAKGVLTSPLRLPAVLNAIAFDEESEHAEYDTVSAGQFSTPAQGGAKARKLRSIDLETLTLTYDAPFLAEAGLDPDDVRDQLEAILRSKKAVTLTLVIAWGEPKPLLRMHVTFRSLHTELRPQENDTLYFTIGIKEWRDAGVERKSSKAGRKPGGSLPTTHKLTRTDTLHSLAHEFYGSYADWRDIRDANGISRKFGQGTPLVSLGRFKVGSVVKIPKPSATSSTRGSTGGTAAP